MVKYWFPRLPCSSGGRGTSYGQRYVRESPWGGFCGQCYPVCLLPLKAAAAACSQEAANVNVTSVTPRMRGRETERPRALEDVVEQLSPCWPLLSPDFLFCKKSKPFFIQAIFSPKVA